MKKYILILLLPIVASLNSCEPKILDDTLPYEKKLVVNCLLTEGEENPTLTLSKVLPPDFYWGDKDKLPPEAYVQNPTGYIDDGDKKYEMFATNDTLFYFKDLVPEAGKTYTLNVAGEGLNATAETYIPQKIKIDTAYIDTIKKVKHKLFNFTYYEAINVFKFTSPDKAAIKYSATFYYDEDIIETDEYCKVEDANIPANQKTNISLMQDQLENLKGDSIKTIMYISVFDWNYYKYFYTQDNGNKPGGLFSSSGNNIYSNMSEDAIGYFYGVTRQELELPDYWKNSNIKDIK
jgi:hypothetical protein